MTFMPPLHTATETLRMLHHYYMKSSRANLYQERNGFPVTIDFVNPSASIVVAVLQHFSSILATHATCGRLRLIYAQHGCSSFKEWRSSFPDEVLIFQRDVHYLCASLEHRQAQYSANCCVSGLPIRDWPLCDPTSRLVLSTSRRVAAKSCFVAFVSGHWVRW